MNTRPHIVILAAGKGTRMNSDLPKVLHRLDGLPLLRHVLFTAGGLPNCGITVVVGYQAELVRYAVDEEEGRCVNQGEMLGTGHAVIQALADLPMSADPILVLYGDVPLIRLETLRELVESYEHSGAAAVIITAKLEHPTGYGRILRDASGEVLGIVEEKDASPEQKALQEVNIGVGIYQRAALDEALRQLQPNNAQGEYYLTDVVGLLRQSGERVVALLNDDPEQFHGVNTPEDLARCEELLYLRGQE